MPIASLVHASLRSASRACTRAFGTGAKGWPRTSKSLSKVDQRGSSCPFSIREIVGYETPARRARSRVEIPRRVRSARIQEPGEFISVSVIDNTISVHRVLHALNAAGMKAVREAVEADGYAQIAALMNDLAAHAWTDHPGGDRAGRNPRDWWSSATTDVTGILLSSSPCA